MFVEMKSLFFFLTFRKEQRIQRLERDIADEKKKAERLLDNMVTLNLYSFHFIFSLS